MQKAAEIMKAERKKEQEKRDEYVRSKIGTLNLDGLDESESNLSFTETDSFNDSKPDIGIQI